ncbi:MAG: DivIVA domain-containing protein [Oscillospiraceae bacterium]|jgi:cell division initiation protein|nr:DivIVA domain-containing protein [Oscillospiraceae bacterium]
MLVPRDISSKKFERGAFGYRIDEVDNYLSYIAGEYSKVLGECNDMEQKLALLSEKVEKYQREEGSLSAVLLGAQKLGENIIKEAKEKSNAIVREAELQSDKMLEGTQKELERERQEYEQLKREVGDFKSNVLSMYRQSLEIISSLPGGDTSRQIAAETKPEIQSAGEQSLPSSIDAPLRSDAEFAEESLDETAERISVELEMERGEQEQNIRRKGFLPNLEKKPDEAPQRAFTFDEDYLQQYVLGGDSASPLDTEDLEYENPSESASGVREEHISPKFGELRFGQDYNLIKNDKKKKRRR